MYQSRIWTLPTVLMGGSISLVRALTRVTWTILTGTIRGVFESAGIAIGYIALAVTMVIAGFFITTKVCEHEGCFSMASLNNLAAITTGAFLLYGVFTIVKRIL